MFAKKIPMLHVAIASYISTGAYDANALDEDALAKAILTQLGISHEIVAWSAPEVDWSRFSHVLIKSTWDYFDHYPAFLAWIAHLEKLGIPTLNEKEILRWNSSKSYLMEIESSGFPCIAGKLLPKGSMLDLPRFRQDLGSDNLVFKPLVSGGANKTCKLKKEGDSTLERQVASWLQEEDFLVQAFIQEIEHVGEYSLIFFNEVFSHAVLKSPAASDFRVQHYYGGSIRAMEPREAMLSAAQALVDRFAKNTLYARVDGVEINGVFHLMELELIEPYLFLGLADQAIPNYQAALKKRLLGK
ncbi:MAG: hypothetical protein RL407_822 [Bacteroidota bacterium]|jgi:Prokaryotic glutathione synthetase, ATP-grasp domain